jgi:hypothetical protein
MEHSASRWKDNRSSRERGAPADPGRNTTFISLAIAYDSCKPFQRVFAEAGTRGALALFRHLKLKVILAAAFYFGT